MKKSSDSDAVKGESSTERKENRTQTSPDGSASTFYTECSVFHDASFNVIEQDHVEIAASSFTDERGKLGRQPAVKDSKTILREFTSGHDASFHVPVHEKAHTASYQFDEGNNVGGQSVAKDSKSILKEFTSGREKPMFQQPFNPNRLEESPGSPMPLSVVIKRVRTPDSQGDDDDDDALADSIDVLLGRSASKFPTMNDIIDDTELADKIDSLLSANSGAHSTPNETKLNNSLGDLELEPFLLNIEQSVFDDQSSSGNPESSLAEGFAKSETQGDISPIAQNDHGTSTHCFSSYVDEGYHGDERPDTKKNSAKVLTELLRSQHDISKAFGELALGMAKLVDEKELNKVAKPRFFQRLRKNRTPLIACEDEEASAGSAAKDDGSLLSFRLLGRKTLFSRGGGGDELASATSIPTKDDGSRLSLRRFRKNYVSLVVGEDEHASTNSIATNDDVSFASIVGRELSETCAFLDDSKLKPMNMNHVANLIDALVVRQEEIAVQIVSIAADAMRKAEDKELEIQRLQHTLQQLESYVSSKRTSAKRRLSVNSLSTFGSNKVWPRIDEKIEESSIASDCSEELLPGIPRMIDISHTIVDIEKICEYDGEDDTASFIPDGGSVRLLM